MVLRLQFEPASGKVLNDKVTTAAGFILIVFFPTFILVASMIQGRLEKRKDAHKAAAKARAKSAEWQRGW